MSAREVMAKAIATSRHKSGEEWADNVISALTAAGHRILSDADVKAIEDAALERAAKMVEEYVWDEHALKQATDVGRAVHYQSTEIVSAIRALKGEKR